MNTKDLSQTQRQALLDLLVLAMYADGRLTSAEDARVQRFLATLGFASDYDRGREFDAAVTRIRRNNLNPDSLRTHAVHLAQRFDTAEQQRQAYTLLNDLLTSDRDISDSESRLLDAVKDTFQTAS